MKQILKNKKAILMQEVFRIIVAVLCLVLLIILAVQLYSIFTRSNALEQAKATLNEIITKSENFEKLGDSSNLLVLAPKGWSIIGFKDQLCICELSSDKTQLEKECSLKGACRKINATIYFYCGLGDPDNMIPNCLAMSQTESSGAQKLPFQLFVTNGFNEIILSLTPYSEASSGTLTRGFFVSYLDSINDVKLNNSVADYVKSNTAQNKKAIIDLITSKEIIKAAAKEGYRWQLQLRTPDGSAINELINSDESKPCSLSSSTDYHPLNGVDMGPSFKTTSKNFINLGIYLCK